MRKQWIGSLTSVILLVGCASSGVRGPAGHNMNMMMGMNHEAISLEDEQVIIQQCSANHSDSITQPQQDVIDENFATPEHRTAHSLWHAVRSIDPGDMPTLLTAWGAGWDPGPKHRLCPPPQNNPDASNYNPIGEDFLYMHHQMVLELQNKLLEKKAKCITPWTSIPADDAVWPVPGRNKSTGVKSNAAYQRLVEWDQFIQNPDNLSQISLSQLGWALEFTIHNNLHMRYATDRPLKRFQADPHDPNKDGAPVPLDGNFSSPWPYNDKAYNWLADPYSAAVNPVFWKIHGYVDHALTLWLQANNKDYATYPCPEVANHKPDPRCYEWKGRWVGAPIQLNLSAGIPPGGPPKSLDPLPLDGFNQRRLDQQRLGVLEDGELAPPGGNLGASPRGGVDLIEVARQRLCP